MTDFDLSIYPTEDFVSFKRCNSTDGTQQIEPGDYEPLAKRLTTGHERVHNQESTSFLPIQNCSSEVISARINNLNRYQQSPSSVPDSLVCSGLLAQHRSNCSSSTLNENVPSSLPHSPLPDKPRLLINIKGPTSVAVCPGFFLDSNSNPSNVCDFDEDEEAMSSQLFKDLPTSLAEFELNLDREKRFSPPALPFTDTPRSPVESCASIVSRSPSAYLPVFEEDEFYPDAEDLEVAMITESFENQMRESQAYSSDVQNVSPTLSDIDPYGPAYTSASQAQDLTFSPKSSGFGKHVYSEVSTPCDSIWRPSTDQSCDNSFDIEDMVLTNNNSTLSMTRNPSSLEPPYSPLSFDNLLQAPKPAGDHHSDAVVDEQFSDATEALAHNVVESLFDNSTSQFSGFPQTTASSMTTTQKTSASPEPMKPEPQPHSSARSQQSGVKADSDEQAVPERDGDVVDSWEELDSDDFYPRLAAIQSAFDKVSIQNQKKNVPNTVDQQSSKTKIADLDHVLEAYELNTRIPTEDIQSALEELNCDTRVIRVDELHAIVVFASHHEAVNTMVTKRPHLLKLRPLADASAETLKKVENSRRLLAPQRTYRAPTNVSVARRLIENSLGQRSAVSAEKRLREREQLKAARELKKQIANIWDA